MRRVNLVITMGDPAGIGPEVLAKSLNSLGRIKDAAFFVLGDPEILARSGLRKIANVSILNVVSMYSKRIRPGVANGETANLSLKYLSRAVELIKNGSCDCLVTGPISKESVRKAGFVWPGHTEFLASSFKVKSVEMIFVSERMKVVLLTRHMALQDAIKSVTKARIQACSGLMLDVLKRNFKIHNPKIAICGLNPHAGENGLFGRQEINSIAPALKQLNKTYGRHFFGPLPSDTVFYHAYQGEFDLVMAMYHDQGLIPFKMTEFSQGVNMTAGLPFVRTSCVHGTAFDIAGKNIADPGSMKHAIMLAYQLAKNSLR